MYTITIQQPKFHSNIYVHRQIISDWLTKYVQIRLNVGTYVMTPDNIKQLDALLIRYHYIFINVKKSIETLEKDTFSFSA